MKLDLRSSGWRHNGGSLPLHAQRYIETPLPSSLCYSLRTVPPLFCGINLTSYDQILQAIAMNNTILEA
jgi:hypothetical protein